MGDLGHEDMRMNIKLLGALESSGLVPIGPMAGSSEYGNKHSWAMKMTEFLKQISHH